LIPWQAAGWLRTPAWRLTGDVGTLTWMIGHAKEKNNRCNQQVRYRVKKNQVFEQIKNTHALHMLILSSLYQ